MIALYLAAGMAVSLILYVFRDKSTVATVSKSATVIKAIFLTALFWPFVLLFIFFESTPEIGVKKSRVKRKDLLLPVNINSVEERELVRDPNNIAPELPFGRLHSQWQALKQKTDDNNTIWSFKTHAPVRHNNEIIEGYALVDEHRNIIDYLVVSKYKENYQTNKVIH